MEFRSAETGPNATSISNAELNDQNAVRSSADVSLPGPTGSYARRQSSSRRLSLSLLSAIDDSDNSLTPTIARPELEPTSSRLSFSSLYSIGSAIFPGSYRMSMSGPASNSGSDEGVFI